MILTKAQIYNNKTVLDCHFNNLFKLILEILLGSAILVWLLGMLNTRVFEHQEYIFELYLTFSQYKDSFIFQAVRLTVDQSRLCPTCCQRLVSVLAKLWSTCKNSTPARGSWNCLKKMPVFVQYSETRLYPTTCNKTADFNML